MRSTRMAKVSRATLNKPVEEHNEKECRNFMLKRKNNMLLVE